MRKTFRACIALPCLLVLATGVAQAQPVPPPLSAPLQAAGAARTVATGTVQRLLANPGGDIDGLLLADGTQVNFPPQPSPGSRLPRIGERVTVSGWRTPVAQVVRAATVSGGTGDRALRIDARPPGGAAPGRPGAAGNLAALVALHSSGTIVRRLYTDRGDANGVLLDNGTLVRLPPHAARALHDTLQPGRSLHVRGWGSRTDAGDTIEANALGATADLQDILAGPAPRHRRPGAADGRPPAGAPRPAPPVPAGDATAPPPAPAPAT